MSSVDRENRAVSHGHADEVAVRNQLHAEWGEYLEGGLLALKRSGESNPGWTDAEIVVLHGYTRSSPEEYKYLNQALRGELDATTTAKWQCYKRLLIRALNKLPNFVGLVFRGIKVDQDEIDRYQVGEIIEWPAFSSFTKLENRSFSGKLKFIMFVKRGKSIKLISDTPWLDEVLLAPSTKIMVHDVVKKADGVTDVYCEEIVT